MATFRYNLQSGRIVADYLNKTNGSYLISNNAFFGINPDGIAIPLGVSVVSQIGTAIASASSDGVAIPSGVSTASSIGTTTTKGDGNVSVSGVSATSQIGTAVASGTTAINGTALPYGVASASQIGSVTTSGTAIATPSGVSVTSAVGIPPVVSGNAMVIPDSVHAVASIGIATASGDSIATPMGVSASSSIGSVIAFETIDGIAYPNGVYRTSYVTNITLKEYAEYSKTDIENISKIITNAKNMILAKEDILALVSLQKVNNIYPYNEIVNVH